jgi:uncharacterized membrane protein
MRSFKITLGIACALALLAAVVLAVILHIFVFLQIIMFLVLTLSPGFLLLKILKIHRLGIAKTLVYSVGLSAAFIMSVGLCVNTLFPMFGINKPMSVLPVSLAIYGLILILGTIAYFRNKKIEDWQITNEIPIIRWRVFFPLLSIILLPFIAVLAALYMRTYQDNFLLLVIIAVVILIPVLVAIRKFIPESLYPLSIGSIALVLLLSQTLVSRYLIGWDIHEEYFYQMQILTNGYWGSTFSSNVNSMLSITMLGPIYSLMTSIDLIWILKIVYPLIFSVVPITLFFVYREHSDPRKAFFAVFFFMSMYVFFTEMTQLARQQIAELFFCLIILVIVDTDLPLSKKRFLVAVFALALVVSHYGLSYIFLSMIIIGWILKLLSENPAVLKYYSRLREKLSGKLEKQTDSGNRNSLQKIYLLRWTFVILFFGGVLSWYMYISSGSPFETMVVIGQSFYKNVVDFLGPNARESLIGSAVGLDFLQTGYWGRLFRIVYVLTQVLIFLGLIDVFFNLRKSKINIEVAGLSFVSFLILIASIVAPYLSSYFNVSRIYHVSLMLLAPFCIMGCEAILRLLGKLADMAFLKGRKEIFKPAYLYTALCLILIPYYLFNSGFVYEATLQTASVGIPSSAALSDYRFDSIQHNVKDAYGARWLQDKTTSKSVYYADAFGIIQLEDFAFDRIGTLYGNMENIPDNCYIYLRSWNVENGTLKIYSYDGAQVILNSLSINDVPLSNSLDAGAKVYSSPGCEIFAANSTPPFNELNTR